MTRNSMTDLSDHLFMAIERLEDEDMTEDQLELEIRRGKTVASLATQVVNSGNVIIKAQQFQDNRLSDGNLPRQLTGGDSA